MNNKITIFKTTFDTNAPHIVDVEKIFESIRVGSRSKEVIEQILKISDDDKEIVKKEVTRLKKKLPIVCFSGEFLTKKNDGILNHSGLICIDFDHLGERLIEFRKKIENNQYTMACFLSPRQDGLKVIIKIPPEIENHKAYFAGLELYYKEETMDDDSEISRGCFLSYDPNIYTNPDSKVFDIKILPKVTVPQEDCPESQKIKDPHEVYYHLKKWVEKNHKYEDGNKHTFLVAIASACNRFGILQELTESKLIEEYQNKASFVEVNDFIDIISRVYITYSNQFNTSWFTRKGEMNDFNPLGPARDVVYVKDVRDKMIKNFKEGIAKGTTTFFKSIDPNWTLGLGRLMVMGGLPGHGKSTLLKQICLLQSVRKKSKWGIFGPEEKAENYYDDLIHMFVGKSTNKDHLNCMSEKEYNNAMDFINEYFFYIWPKDEAHTPRYMNDRFGELIVKHNIIGCITDPFNQLDNDWGKNGRDDLYISSFLSTEKRFAMINNVYKIIIAHPNGTVEKVKNTLNYQCPTSRQLAGGPMWDNKCDDILATYRPFHGENKTNTEVHFISQKIKEQKYYGIPGTVTLHFDRWSNRYLEFAEQGTEIINGKRIEKLIGLSPFDDNYEKKYNDRVRADVYEGFEQKEQPAETVEFSVVNEDLEDIRYIEPPQMSTYDYNPHE